MKVIGFFLVFCCFSSVLNAQIFHFNEHNTTLVKTTAQSPAHWYIEIFTDISVDSTLRWKAFFEFIPVQWQISLDTQSSYMGNVQDGDSADFTLLQGLEFPQKLIIGATLNDQPGIGSVFFDIYDPEYPSFRDTIEFHFIISSVGLTELVQSEIITIENSIIRKVNNEIATLKILDQTGKLLVADSDFHSFDCSKLPSNELLFIAIQQGKEQYLIKWLR